MTGDRIEPGDILIVDSLFEHVNGRIVVVFLNGDSLENKPAIYIRVDVE